jgi:uncharacterized protein (DUF2235 family)
MKRIVICYDGTWNAVTDPSSVTNVVRLGQAVRKTAKDGTAQTVYYNAGVGSGGPLDRFLGGVFGVGLRGNVKRGLAFLTLNWQPESEEEGRADEIYIFGFSRGAYSARALAGVIAAIGGIPKKEHFDKLEMIWNYYRTDPLKRTPQAKKEIRDYIHGRIVGDDQSAPPTTRPVITCLGVWDTVGSYGIPAGLGLGALARKVTSWTRGFHDNTIGPHVEYGLHAMAIDERRRAFPPTAWIIEEGKSGDRPNVEQVWFAGSHSNIGGGYRRSGLADLALIWMIARVSERTDLEFDDDYIAENFWPCAACSLYNSDRGWVLSSLRPYLRPALGKAFDDEFLKDGKKQTRKMERLNEKVHWSVIERLGRVAIVDELRNRPYAPSNLPQDLPDDVPDEGLPQDKRVAGKTPREKELIALCRREADNERTQHCALFCDLTKLKKGSSRAPFPGLSFVRDMLSAEGRRERRLRRLQEIWEMNQDKTT